MTSSRRYTADTRLRSLLGARLDHFHRIGASAPSARPAAVALVVVAGQDGRAELLVTRRAARLRVNSGQWALPGGGLEPGEDASSGARRELREELGLDLAASSVLGMLDDYVTRSGYLITPVVLWGGPTSVLAPASAEVAAIHRVGLVELDAEGSRRLLRIPESDRPVLQLRLASLGTVHAPTAAFLYQFRQVLLRHRTTRVAQYDQPVFAWR